MESHDNYKIPLGELLAILKTNGYEVSVERILEIQSVLLSTPVSKLSIAELKFIITPVLARNEEDQKNIYKIIDAYITDKIQFTETKAIGISAFFKNRYVIFGLKITGFILIITTAFLIYLSQKKDEGKIHSINYSRQLPPADTSRINKNPASDTAKPKPQSPGNNSPVSSKVGYNGKAIVPTRLNIILQMSAAFGLGLGGILYYLIFFERRKRMEAKKKTKEEDEAFAAGKEKDKKVAAQLVYATLQFPEKNFLIQKTREFPIIRANLKKTAFTGTMNLDVKESIYATTKSGGFPSLVFDNDWKERKYLILSDHEKQDAHINQLFDFFINFLGSSKIPIVKYSYTTDIRILNNRYRESMTLEDLSYDYPDYHLIITGDCHSFFNTDTLLLDKDLDALFQRWTARSIITPTPLRDWSYQEVQLQNSLFNIVPAEISAIELLTRSIAEDSSIKPGMLANRIRDKYSATKYDFKTAIEIRDYLDNEELFQVVCSLAVYPKLNWNITVALFAAILKRNPNTAQAIKLDYDTLLKISRIPWLNSGQLEESYRLQLFNFLKPGTEIIARETILQLLNEINPFVERGSPASKELQVQLKINSFFLYAHDPQQYRQYADVKNEFLDSWNNLDEWALKERVTKGLMPVTGKGDHETVEEFVLQEKQFEKRNVTFLRVVLLTMPAALLYILLAIFRPSIVYLDSYEKVSFLAVIKKDSRCKKEITQVIVSKLDKFDTMTLKKYNNINYIQINNTEYNRTVGLSFLFADGTFTELPIEAKDSTVVISLKCPG